jgi:beta-exotoxin I transport system ATP-binding protein
MHRPDLVVLDEPTSGLDPLMQNEFERLVREVVGDGRTVFLSSHDLEEVQRVADDIGIIRSGVLVTTGSVEDLRGAAPDKVEVRFTTPVDRRLFGSVPGVSVTSCDGTRLALDVTRPAIARVLRLLADHDPVDVVIRHADLEELFLDLYRGDAPAAADAS